MGGFSELVEIVARVRAECPWDREQTHESLCCNLIEEAYEVVDAIESGESEAMSEELGDLLMQVLLHAEIASEEKRFALQDVIGSITDKLIRRHPHVFDDLELKDSDAVLENWERIKRGEKDGSALAGVPSHLPALAAAKRLQEKAARTGFDWKTMEPVVDKVKEEIDELACAAPECREEELGDLLFALTNMARFMGIDPEGALRKSNNKFRGRFYELEKKAREQGRPMESYTLEELDVFWEDAKRNGK